MAEKVILSSVEHCSSAKMAPMASPDDHTRTFEARKHLAETVQKRRQALGLSVRAAADAAGMARNTWTAIEEGGRKTADSNYAGIERALRWVAGSVTAVLAGGQPTEAPAGPNASVADQHDEALIRVMLSDLPDERKQQIVAILIAERDEADKRRVAHAEQLIHLVRDDR